MDSGKDSVAPQYREMAGIKKSTPEARSNAKLPDSNLADPMKAAYPQPVSKSQQKGQDA